MKTAVIRIKKTLVMATTSAIVAMAGNTQADLSIAPTPLFLGVSPDPNVLFVVDDSGSMDWSVTTTAHFLQCAYYATSNSDNGHSTRRRNPYVGQYYRGTSCSNVTSYHYSFNNKLNKYNNRACNSNTTSGDTKSVTQGYCTGESSDNYSPTDKNHDWRPLSSDLNATYFDPGRKYLPWHGKANMEITKAKVDGDSTLTSNNGTRDLTGLSWAVWIDDKGWNENASDWPGHDIATMGANGWVDVWDNYVRYKIYKDGSIWKVERTPYTYNISGTGPYSASKGTVTQLVEGDDISGNDDLAGARREDGTLDMELLKTNVANWFTYHRKRQHVSKYAVGDVIIKQPDLRYGFHTINNRLTIDLPTADYKDDNSSYVKHNDNIIESYFEFRQGQYGTPLKSALSRAGRYYEGKKFNNNGKYDISEGMGSTEKTDRITSSCQANYTLLFTDGFYSEENTKYGDHDGDGSSDTLADIARYFYITDLRPDLDDNVGPVSADPADWQHMNTFTVAFGVSGLLQDTDSPEDGIANDPVSGKNLTVDSKAWGAKDIDQDSNNDPRKIDDLWHAAVNSYSQFISAKNPQELIDGINRALSEIVDRTGSAAAVAASTGSLNTDTHVYQAKFDSKRWSGSLVSLPFSDGTHTNTEGHPCSGKDPVTKKPLYPRGTLCPSEWDAATVLAGQNFSSGRAIITNVPSTNPAQGHAFKWSNLNATQQASLQNAMPSGADGAAYGEAIVNYLRGDRSNEDGKAGTYKFRLRSTPLGDIVHSSPQYVQAPINSYPNAVASKDYSSFRAANLDRQAVVYAGANDGMMHAFNADTGEELMAFIPNGAYNKLGKLAETDYSHEYLVDGSPTVVDVYFNSKNSWKTVLAAGMGGGGRSVFALDVTDPTKFSEANADSLFLWEYSNDDLGYTYSDPQLVKLNNGQWGAVFGNGYNSDNQKAMLFIINIETGVKIAIIDTSNDGDTNSSPNGLSTPNVVDVDGDSVADYVYAGDLQGNMWKFDLTDKDEKKWKVAITEGGKKAPLFQAINEKDEPRPIMAQPVVNTHPLGRQFGYMVYFGTGKYIGREDAIGGSSQPLEDFYGIADRKASGSFVHEKIEKSELLQQFLVEEAKNDFYSVTVKRDSSNKVIETPGKDSDGNDVVFVDVYNKDTKGYDRKSKTELVQEGVLYEEWYRHSTQKQINFYATNGLAQDKGWFMTLCAIPDLGPGGDANCFKSTTKDAELKSSYNNQSEKQTVRASFFDGVITFNTAIPSSDECSGGGDGWIMKVNATNGAQLNQSPYDFNRDGLFDSKDLIGLNAASGAKIDGIPTSSTRIGEHELTVSSDAQEGIDVKKTNVTSTPLGRYKWRRLLEE
ncbi:hypothetical protein MIB92_11020 [Aestuariirhabdus sp. Z084]|uniref:pilus assembly protein n=1 Tax=Aestuariirhabdus haliotis TaxID=2918751 RepID=UPI00201B3CA8|nr:PilC/PilY family type IV pilus protein [Aestuariirhabdus haliotis]MCL6416183.1 hypothetical protein [Aestuariirhabdus haliotis]MCL6420235.1 hypothetical protein [Aestuariirhabdus haliotis]